MAGTDDRVQIGQSADYLEGVSVDTTAGTGLFREGVVVSDPVVATARARVLDTTPATDDFGQVVRVVGGATEASLSAGVVSLGTDGTSPPVIAGTGVRGWLRSIYEKLLGSINVASTRPSSYTTGILTAAGQAVTITVPEGQSSSTVYLKGTFSAGSQVSFEGSPNGTDWHALNMRRNTDAASNETTNLVDANPFGGPGPNGANPSNWRGVIGGIRFFRVRCNAFQAGDAIEVQIVTSAGVGATFLNVGLPASANIIGFTGPEFAAQARQGRAYTITSTRLTPTLGAVAANLLVLYNPAASGKTVFIDRISVGGVFGGNVQGAFDRVRFTGVPTGGTTVTPVSRNSSATPSTTTAIRANVTAGAIGGVGGIAGVQEESVNFVGGGNDRNSLDGSLILPPGVGISIQLTCAANTAASVAASMAYHEV